MPNSGEMRLRHLSLALIALTGIWIGVLIQRGQDAPTRVAIASQSQPADFPTPRTKLVHVAGLSRPVAATPIVKAPSRPHVSTPAPATSKLDVQVRQAETPSKTESSELDLGGAVSTIHEDTRAAAVTPPLPPDPLEIADAQVVALSSTSARLNWRTNVPTPTQAAFGLDAPTIWTQASSASVVDHEAVLTGLEFSTTYNVYLHAVDEWNRAETATLTLTTGPMGARTNARTSGDRILLDERPFFPVAVWGQCADGYGSNINDGINLFMGAGCGDEPELPARLGGRAYSVVDAANSELDGQGVIGRYFPDEWDAFLESNVKRADLNRYVPTQRAGRISFLTLTNHFYSRAEPLPQGKGMYPVLMSIPDVIGFDLYPLQVWCRPAFGDVMDAQRELHDASGGKPTFQWIEVAKMEHPCRNHSRLDPTAATVRAETWLSIAGGANAVGYFPNHWSGDIGQEITRTNRDIKALTQALLTPTVNAHSDAEAVRVSARTLNGALYVIAVNTTETTVQARVTIDGIGLAGRSATILGSGTAVGADDEGFSDSFGPLASRVYVIPPQGW
jgi:hypothetical protein